MMDIKIHISKKIAYINGETIFINQDLVNMNDIEDVKQYAIEKYSWNKAVNLLKS